MPRTNINVSVPRFTFLSCEIRSINVSTGGTPPGTSFTWVGKPTAARCADARAASAAAMRPFFAENSKASAIPSATASPCSSRSEKPQPASSACPKVWPRLSSARSPVSRSSRATMPALARQHTAIACSRAGPPAKTSCQFFSSQAKNAASPSKPVFRDLGIARAKFPFRQRVEQRRIRNDQNRLMERADEILTLARIDSGLAADGRIDLRQQRGRHLHKVETAPRACSRKPCKIADHAATKRHDEIVAFDTRGDDRLANFFKCRVVL